MALLNDDGLYIKILSISEDTISYRIYYSQEARDLEKQNLPLLVEIKEQINLILQAAYTAMLERAQVCGFTEDDAKDMESIGRCLERDATFKALYQEYHAYHKEDYDLTNYMTRVIPEIPSLPLLEARFPSLGALLKTGRPDSIIEGTFMLVGAESKTLAECYEEVAKLKIFKDTINI